MKRLVLSLVATLCCVQFAAAQKVPVQEITLDNGMRVLLVQRKGDPNVAAGWIAHVGSVNERPGITGISSERGSGADQAAATRGNRRCEGPEKPFSALRGVVDEV